MPGSNHLPELFAHREDALRVVREIQQDGRRQAVFLEYCDERHQVIHREAAPKPPSNRDHP